MDERPSKMTIKELKELLEKFDENFDVVVGGGAMTLECGNLCVYDNKGNLVEILLECED